MGYFIAKNDKQLGICLRMLLAEGLEARLEMIFNSKGKVEFHVMTDVNFERFDELNYRYKTLIS